MNPIYTTPWNKTINLDELLEIQSEIGLDSENGPGLCIYLWYKGQTTHIRCHRPMVEGAEYDENKAENFNWFIKYSVEDPTKFRYVSFKNIEDNAKGSIAYQNFEKEIEQVRLAWARWKEYALKYENTAGRLAPGNFYWNRHAQFSPPQSPFAPDPIDFFNRVYQEPLLPMGNFWPRALHLSIKNLTNVDLKEINILEFNLYNYNKIEVKSSGASIEKLLAGLEENNLEIQNCSVSFNQLSAQKTPIQFYIDKQHYLDRQPAYRFVPSEEIDNYHNAKVFPRYPVDYHFSVPFLLTKDSVIAMDIPAGDTIDLNLIIIRKIPVLKKSKNPKS